MTNNSKEKQAIDLFSGVGGLSLGLHEAGWDVIASFEYDQAAVENYKANFPDSNVYHQDVREIDFKQFSGVGLVAGGPPCQPFSVAGKMLAKDDPRDMVPQFYRAVKEAKPLAFLMENVPGIITPRHIGYCQKVATDLADLGYKVFIKKLHAYEYGVPQNRYRIFFVGFQDKVEFGFPLPTHGPKQKKDYYTSGAALKDAPEDAPNNTRIVYAASPVMRPSPFAGMLVNGQGRPINLKGACHTIPATAGGNRTHIYDPEGVLVEYHTYLKGGGKPREGIVKGVRRITVRESARIQSFPDQFRLIGKRSVQYRLVGNAVPPLLAKAVGKTIFDALFDTKKVREKTTLKDAMTVTKDMFSNGYLEQVRQYADSLPN